MAVIVGLRLGRPGVVPDAGRPGVERRGEPVGRVKAVENFGATDVIEIERPDGKAFMVPLTREAVPEWDGERLIVAEGFVD